MTESKKPKESKPLITRKEGKTIFDEKGFLNHLNKSLVFNKTYLQRSLQDELRSAISGQKVLGSWMNKKISKAEGSPYTIDYLHYPWPNSGLYQDMQMTFHHHPAFAEPFVNAINQHFYAPVLKGWQAAQAVSYFPKTSDYFARALPGSREAARKRADDAYVALSYSVQTLSSRRFKQSIYNSYNIFFANRWKTFQGCLLPNGYMPGKSSYGRLKSVPPSTLANANKKLKLTVLSSIKSLHGISFFELDLVSCHAKIFENLFNWKGFDRADLPPLDKLWPTMIADFWEKAAQVAGFDEIKSQIQAWPEGYLKGLLKNQYYKSLNGGMATFVEDNIDRSKLKLGITPALQDSFCEFLHLTFSNMKVFILQTAFIEQVNQNSFLYLPNIIDGFNTSTPSKAQLRKMADPDYVPKSLTGNSRLFSNVELCLIMHVYASIVAAQVDWLVIAYESDGVLIACCQDYDQVLLDLEKVNVAFKNSIKCLTTANHELDVKNYV